MKLDNTQSSTLIATPPTQVVAEVDWTEKLRVASEEAATAEAAQGSGGTISLRGGDILIGDLPAPNKTLVCVVLSSVYENIYYGAAYDAGHITPPVCWARGIDADSMRPDSSVTQSSRAQHQDCATCPQNQWGSAATGRGKACKNTRRLAVIVAGTMRTDGKGIQSYTADMLAAQPIYTMRIPVTSGKAYAAYVRSVATAAQRPPWAVTTMVRCEPDPRTMFRVHFECVATLDTACVGVCDSLLGPAMSVLSTPYQAPGDASTPGKPPPSGTKRASRGARF